MNAAARVAIKRFARTHVSWTPAKVHEHVIRHASATGPFFGNETLQDIKDVMASMDDNGPRKLF